MKIGLNSSFKPSYVGMEAIANGRANITPAIIRFITKSPLLVRREGSRHTVLNGFNVVCLKLKKEAQRAIFGIPRYTWYSGLAVGGCQSIIFG
jgi:hypothetical protein